MRYYLSVFFMLFIIFVSCSDSNNNLSDGFVLGKNDKDEIMTTFLGTQEAWNRGDLEGFMEAYWKSDSLAFTGVKGPTYGYDATLKRYMKAYPDREAMGLLKFNVKDLRKIDTSTALMIGKFYLSRTIGDITGYYTLVWQKIDGKWFIISDHSSGEHVRK